MTRFFHHDDSKRKPAHLAFHGDFHFRLLLFQSVLHKYPPVDRSSCCAVRIISFWFENIMLNGNEKRGGRGSSGGFLRRARCTVARLFGFLGSKTSKALHFASGSRMLTASRATQQAPASAPDADCEHLSEAMEDCIKFLHSSSRKA